MVFDYIIVGSGSSGAILAHRLASAGNRVALLEAGQKKHNLWSYIPGGYYKLISSAKSDWNYHSIKQCHLNNRIIPCPRGKMLGGCSAMNGLVYIRGHKNDYDRWAAVCDNDTWNYNNVIFFFKKHENNVDFSSDKLHSTEGEVSVSFPDYRTSLVNDFLFCANKYYRYNPDFNGLSQDGYGLFQLTMHKGVRNSTSYCFLNRKVKKLTIIAETLVDKVIFRDKKAMGVSFYRKGKYGNIYSEKEVILCAGAICSPLILQRSGIGPSELLRQFGISATFVNEQVGKNLKDHFQARIIYKTHPKNSLNSLYHSLYKKIVACANYILFRKGELTIGAGVAGIFFSSTHDESYPDLQMHLIPFSAETPGVLFKTPGITCSVTQLRPQSSGEVKITSPDPSQSPYINFNYLANDNDLRTLAYGMKKMHQLFTDTAMEKSILGLLVPDEKTFDDEQKIADYIKNTGTTIFHPVGTCRMTKFDADDGVVNPDLTVKGVHGLRIADASIMPEIISGNTNAACMMIGEKAADIILQKTTDAE